MPVFEDRRTMADIDYEFSEDTLNTMNFELSLVLQMVGIAYFKSNT